VFKGAKNKPTPPGPRWAKNCAVRGDSDGGQMKLSSGGRKSGKGTRCKGERLIWLLLLKKKKKGTSIKREEENRTKNCCNGG